MCLHQPEVHHVYSLCFYHRITFLFSLLDPYRKAADILGLDVKRCKRTMKAFTQRTESNFYPTVVYVISWKRKWESWLLAPCKGGQLDASEEVPVGSFILTHNALHLLERHKDRKCDPGLITVWAAISENSEQRADKEVSVRLPLACFVRCGSMNVSLCVKNGQFALSSCHVESVRNKKNSS